MKRLIGAFAALLVAMALVAPSAGAVSYQLDPVTPFFPTGKEDTPIGIAIEQSTGKVFVANFGFFTNGSITQYDAEGVAGSPAAFEDEAKQNSGVAVDPVSADHHVYGLEAVAGVAQIVTFDTVDGSVVGTPFPVTSGIAVQIATDSAGLIYVPNHTDNRIDKWSPAGVLQGSLDCATGCESTPLSEPADVAVAANGDVYVADKGNGRVVKFPASGSPSVFYTGASSALAIDPSSGNVFVGGDDGEGFHITVHEAASGTQIGDFGLGAFPAGNATKIAVNGTSGKVYATDRTEIEPVVFIFEEVVSPAPTTTAASGITAAAATLNGTVNPNEGGAITGCEFEWGTTTAYTGGTVPCAEKPADGNAAVAVKGSLAGLAPNTTYHFQLVVDNGSGAVKGGDQSFKTLFPAPSVTTEAATGTTQTTATLNAKVNANGADAECSFEYGTSLAYGTSVPCSVNPVKGSVATAVSAAIAGLSAGTTYHYRVVGKNEGGKAEGNDATFTTQSAPAPPAGGGGSTPPVATPPPTTTPPVTKKPLKCKKGFKKKTVKGKAKCVKVKKKHGKH